MEGKEKGLCYDDSSLGNAVCRLELGERFRGTVCEDGGELEQAWGKSDGSVLQFRRVESDCRSLSDCRTLRGRGDGGTE